MSYEPTTTYKTCFRVFLACRHERNPRNKSSSSAGSCASRDDAKDLASVNSKDYRDRRCIARRLSSDDPNCILLSLVRLYFFLRDGCSAGSLLFFCLFFRAGVVHFVQCSISYKFLANHSAVSQPHPTKGAERYCCIQAGGILAATEVCCAGYTCAGRCARRLFVLLVVPFLLLS